MQVCDGCGAYREFEWRRCPFCHADLAVSTAPSSAGHDQFDALAAAAEGAEDELLPSLAPELTADEEVPADDLLPSDELLTENDLAHLTGMAGPDVNSWDPATPPPPPSPEPDEGDSVPRLVVVPLVAAAILAVVFVAYSIVTQTPAERPDAVALIDRSTTTQPITTTTTEPTVVSDGAVLIGDDIAEQAARMCRGDQFSIARSSDPSLAIYNDVMVATQDGRDDWAAPPDQEMLRGPVPPLVGCLRTADAGEIDRCPDSSAIISRRAVEWSYRVLRTVDGTEVGSDSGVARDVRPCDELVVAAAGSDYGSWSALPQDELDATAAAYTTAPHPQAACRAFAVHGIAGADQAPFDERADPEAPPTELPPRPSEGLAIHATAYGTPAIDHPLPAGWTADDDRPVDVVLCLMRNRDVLDIAGDAAGDLADREPAADPGIVESPEPAIPDTAPESPRCDSIVVAAMDRSGILIGSYTHPVDTCPAGTGVTVPIDFLVEVVGPDLGYPLDVPGVDSEDGSVPTTEVLSD